MAGLPLKSGADFYNLEAARMRLHNLGADPTEVGAGLIYFNTSTGLNTSQKARLYTGSAWKTIAFSEDLDVASNADFLALKERVDLLSGDVDTDAIISNMKEVSAFLEGFAEEASLMDLLNGKLDKSGGTMTGTLTLPTLVFNSGMYLDTSGAKDLIVYDNTSRRIVLHSGNVGDYALKNYDNQGAANFNEVFYNGIQYAGSRSSNTPLKDAVLVSFFIYDSSWQIIGGRNSNKLMFRSGTSRPSEWNNWKTIAFTDSNVASASKLETARTIWGQSFDGTGNVDGVLTIGGSGHSTFNTRLSSNALLVGLDENGNTTKFEIGWRNKDYRSVVINSSGNVTIGASDLAGTDTKLYVDGHIKLGANGYLYKNDKTVIDFAGDAPLFGYGTAAAGLGTKVYGFDIRLYYGGTTNVGFILNNSGNVGIGTTDPQAKLDVNGAASIRDELYLQNASYSASGEGSFLIRYYNGVLQFNSRTADDVPKSYPLTINYDTDEATFNGDLHVRGNIIADGEVSAGGAGTEGGNAGGGGAFHSESIAVGATQTTIAHGLGTDDIVVSIYEKDGVSGRWSLILTDVEVVDANNIIVSFGSATSVEHKVVIMGAVA